VAETPLHVDGEVDGPETVDNTPVRAALEELPEGRLCRKCNRRVFTHSDHCPKPCGAVLEGNSRAMTHARYAKKGLRKRREEIYAEVAERYPYAPDTIRRPYAAAVALSERAAKWSEDSPLALSSDKQQKAIKVFNDAVDRVARLGLVLENTQPEGPVGLRQHSVTTAGRYKGPSLPEFQVRYFDDVDRGEADTPEQPAGMTDRTIVHIDPGFGMRPLLIDGVSTRAEILEVLGHVRGDDDDDDPIDGEVMTQPSRERGDVTQVTPSGGAIRAWTDSTVLMFSGVTGLRVGQDVTFERQRNRAVAVEGL
jgi:hypothetical protein